MAITSFDPGYFVATKEDITFFKTAATTTVANSPFSIFDLAGTPAAGTLAGSSTTAGVVPDDTVAGFPPITAFAGGATGYLTRVEFSNTAASRFKLYDCLFKAGAYAFNAAQTLSAQPSYSARIPGGNYGGTEIWIEAVTAFTGIPNFAITYTNQAGITGRTTGTVAAPLALTLKRMFRVPLQSGDTGVQKIESVTCTVATVGTFNVLVMRPLVGPMRVSGANVADVYGLDRTGMPVVFDTSALFMVVYPDSTGTGNPDFVFEIASG